MVDVRVHLEQADGVNGRHSEFPSNSSRKLLHLSLDAFESGQQLATAFEIPLSGGS